MTRIRTFLLMIALAAPALALAQWQWIDPSGRRVFSDQPPPSSVPEKNIVQKPVPRGPLITLDAQPAPARPASAASTARAAGKEPEAEARRRTEEADKRKAEEERIARQRADNCARARSAKATVDSGTRLVRTNEKGEREFLDDAARAAESQRLQEIITSDCAGS